MSIVCHRFPPPKKAFHFSSLSAHFDMFNKVIGDVMNDHCGLAFFVGCDVRNSYLYYRIKDFPYRVRIYLHWKGFFQFAPPPLINLILCYHTMYTNWFIVWLVPIRFFFLSQRGLEMVDEEGSFTFNDNAWNFPTLVSGRMGPLNLFLSKIELVVDR